MSEVPPNGDTVSTNQGLPIAGYTPGEVLFERYTIIRILGRGGMAIVWLAHDNKLNREVALKLFPLIITADAPALDELKKEACASLELTHNHIVRTYDFIETNEICAISMEHVDGSSLAELKLDQKNGVYEVRQLTEWARQLCDALEYAHVHARIAHRDLKPANLLLNSRNELKVTDFGIARSLSDSINRLTREDTTSGTLFYMSPQQLDGEWASHLDDIYSFGATIFELLTGRPPFFTGDIARQIYDKKPTRMSERRKKMGIKGEAIPKNWELLIEDCLAKTPWQRPQSFQEIAERLELVPSPAIGTRVRRQVTRFKKAGPVVLLNSWKILFITTAIFVIPAVYLFYKNTATTVIPFEGMPAVNSTESKEIPEKVVSPLPDTKWTNTLGMRFIPFGKIHFAQWETRVQDFDEFIRSTRYEANKDVYSLKFGKWDKKYGHSWKNPGFFQTPKHPVCAVNRDDALAFCRWLSAKEQTAGILAAHQSYRLPSDSEWSAAAGLKFENGRTPQEKDDKIKNEYPWGGDWPPPENAGNYAGLEAHDDDWPSGWVDTNGYRDGYARTSPVGTFAPNQYGIYDMGGNVWEWCDERYSDKHFHYVLRGASWNTEDSTSWVTSRRIFSPSDFRTTSRGFRIVLDLGN
ncbi:MAG: bifunctional serine/threonine-protein kinase/formylglycine-generating enzyme family protein [Verrucomicrobiota bacterium]|nr:bifunctional serine/threonine-protein kinase/formylglycine-generating enzyme family protein [Verrucomicrobiota bacterium]